MEDIHCYDQRRLA